MMNPAFQKKMVDLTQQGAGDGKPPTINKEKAKEIFFFVEEKKAEMMSGMKRGMMQPRSEEEQMQQTMDIIVEHQKMSDAIHEKFDVPEEEFQKCISYYNLLNDPEIAERMKKNYANMPPGVMPNVAMGGQGGGPGPMGF